MSSAWLAQSVEHQTFKAERYSESSEGQGFESLIGRLFFTFFNINLVFTYTKNSNFCEPVKILSYFLNRQHGTTGLTALTAQWLIFERARVQISFATVSKFGHFRSLYDAPVHSTV